MKQKHFLNVILIIIVTIYSFSCDNSPKRTDTVQSIENSKLTERQVKIVADKAFGPVIPVALKKAIVDKLNSYNNISRIINKQDILEVKVVNLEIYYKHDRTANREVFRLYTKSRLLQNGWEVIGTYSIDVESIPGSNDSLGEVSKSIANQLISRLISQK